MKLWHEPWHDDSSQSWRWVRAVAFPLPVRTFDDGWKWFRCYWRWQCISGWGFWDDFAYARKDSR